MNRLSMENRTEPITKDLDFQLQDPFLLYRNARCESFLHTECFASQVGQVFETHKVAFMFVLNTRSPGGSAVVHLGNGYPEERIVLE